MTKMSFPDTTFDRFVTDYPDGLWRTRGSGQAGPYVESDLGIDQDLLGGR